ncbi:hypothetical protein SDC9_173448 [bioreactor metagenome]|uniref:Uncharacterized protein n=1 Tax=bioreactor metagenome TaxID=1076179 RepID=A0A645GII1_9ZZZZ
MHLFAGLQQKRDVCVGSRRDLPGKIIRREHRRDDGDAVICLCGFFRRAGGENGQNKNENQRERCDFFTFHRKG